MDLIEEIKKIILNFTREEINRYLFLAILGLSSYILYLISPFELYIYYRQNILLRPPISILFFIFLGIYLLVTTVISDSVVRNPAFGKICKQFKYFSYVDHFASNGLAKKEFENHKLCNEDCIKITLVNFNLPKKDNRGFTTSSDCGITFEKKILSPFTKGFKIDDKKWIKFQIIGEKGGEKIGLALKNTNGNEEKHPLDDFLKKENKKILNNDWIWIKINLQENYGSIVCGQSSDRFLENFSFFSNSNLSPEGEEQIVYIKKISFEKDES